MAIIQPFLDNKKTKQETKSRAAKKTKSTKGKKARKEKKEQEAQLARATKELEALQKGKPNPEEDYSGELGNKEKELQAVIRSLQEALSKVEGRKKKGVCWSGRHRNK